MPFKEAVLPLLDQLDDTARIIGAVNTVVNDAGILTGYNTDMIGACKALEFIKANPRERVLLLGAGGAARAIMFALRRIGFDKVYVANRSPTKIKSLEQILDCEPVLWEDRQYVNAELLINATSVGMTPNDRTAPIDLKYVSKVRAVMDVVVSPIETRLIRRARELGRESAAGCIMSLEQTIAQFILYTGRMPPRSIMESELRGLQK